MIIPAHNERSVIGRTLNQLAVGRPSNAEVDVIVVCNGCTDDTAAQARAATPSVRVFEVAEASKTKAINHGFANTGQFPALVIDADIEIDHLSLKAVAEVLHGEILAASPAADFDLDQSDRWVRAYYAVWRKHPFLQTGVGGSGVYGLSRAGWERLGQFPSILGDDAYVRRSIPKDAQRRIFFDSEGRKVSARIRAPSRVSDLVGCETRWAEGNRQLNEMLGPVEGRPSRRAGKAGVANRMLYYGVKLFARLRSGLDPGRRARWQRDETSRDPA